MEIQIKQVSSLEKVRANDDLGRIAESWGRTVLAGERFSYQICMKSPDAYYVDISVESALADYIRVYQVRETYMDTPVTENPIPMEDYITQEPGYMPDLLVPLEMPCLRLPIRGGLRTVWVKADIPRDMEPGEYDITLRFVFNGAGAVQEPIFECFQKMAVKVLPAAIGEQRLIYTRWFYADCIADVHGVEIFSEEHWDLIEKYIAAASDVGINMLLVPIHTPPLDTAVGTARPCVQLVDIEEKDGRYAFSFDKFRRFIGICKRHGIRYFEMAHMFSQWGAKCAPNIRVTHDGKTDYRFGWHVAANSPEYIDFLRQYASALCAELQREGIGENTYFHISDEPGAASIDTYRTAWEILRPLIDGKTLDALSDYRFYEKGLVDCPVTSITHIHEFLEHSTPEHPIENQWVYYCCNPQRVYSNGLMAMPSYRVRVLGFLLYKYNIKGFLHWGFNFYNSALSLRHIDPYLTTSSDGFHPSGDPFIVYPGNRCVYPSIRGEVLYEAIQDMDICFVLEGLVGREKVTAMIDRAAGRDLRFDDYPRCREFLENLRAEMEREIERLVK